LLSDDDIAMRNDDNSVNIDQVDSDYS